MKEVKAANGAPMISRLVENASQSRGLFSAEGSPRKLTDIWADKEGMAATLRSAAIAVRPAVAQKLSLHPRCAPIKLAIGSPSTVPIMMPANTMDIAQPR